MYKLSATAILMVLVIACGSSAENNRTKPADKKAQLQQLKERQTALNQQVRTLEEELAKTDTAMANVNAKLVSVSPVTTDKFTHYIDLQGKVDAENISYVTPRGAGGQVKAVLVKQGDNVKKGQLLLRLDDAVIRQQVEQAQIQLELSQTLYDRRKTLWDQNIGTEVELLQAKNNLDNLKKQIALLNEQNSMSNVYAEISGVADMVNIRVGEYFSPQSASTLGIRIVNTSNLKVTAQVPENYQHKIKEGANVLISLPDINKTVKAKITVKGSTIDANSRSFYIEAKIPASKEFRPNQLAMVQIQDYSADNAISIPLNTLQNDEKGKYVMVAINENGRLVARKRPVEVGELYGNNLEVRSGLKSDDTLITEGFQGLYDGQAVITATNS